MRDVLLFVLDSVSNTKFSYMALTSMSSVTLNNADWSERVDQLLVKHRHVATWIEATSAAANRNRNFHT